MCGPCCPITDTHKPKFAGFDAGVCVCFRGPFRHFLMAETHPGQMCVCVFFVKVRRHCQTYRVLRCLGRPGCQKGKNISCRGSPHPKKNDFRSRYVCVFVHVLMAKPTIGKSICVFVCNPCVCFVLSVCVFVCNPCVCLLPIFYRKLRGVFWHA